MSGNSGLLVFSRFRFGVRRNSGPDPFRLAFKLGKELLGHSLIRAICRHFHNQFIPAPVLGKPLAGSEHNQRRAVRGVRHRCRFRLAVAVSPPCEGLALAGEQFRAVG
ncbi:MAG TPA: hypothetical protein PLF81_00470 [Candidatus Anammoximicrobium sp.]|nr:hypothetical protein [Candidatus Anammoximicrobium sp.]